MAESVVPLRNEEIKDSQTRQGTQNRREPHKKGQKGENRNELWSNIRCGPPGRIKNS